MRKKLCGLFLLGAILFLGSCNKNVISSSSSSSSSEQDSSSSYSTTSQTLFDKYNCITIQEALDKCKDYTDSPSEDRFYIYGVIKEITNANYGQMILKDNTGEIEVYGTYSEDGNKKFLEIDPRPEEGDEVVLYSTLQQYNGKNEIKNGRLIEFIHHEKEFNLNDYKACSINEARNKEKGSLVLLEGVVSKISYANGKSPSGFILIDNTSSIYVYDSKVASSVAEGNKITIAGTKDYWILETEVKNANNFSYKGCNQISECTLINNDKKNNEFEKNWIQEKTVKQIINTPFSSDITSLVYKVNALVTKKQGTGFINYYFNDLDEKTGSYTYTQCNGNDFTYLDEFDGKICTVYLTALNAKATASGCVWRFLPVAISDDNYTFDLSKTAQFVMDYYIDDQFKSQYTGDPQQEMISSVSSTLLKFENASITYSSSKEEVISFKNENEKIIMHAGPTSGEATIKIKVKYGNYEEVSKEITISYLNVETLETKTIKQAIDSEVSKENKLTLKGIAGPSLVNRTGFYLIDETGAIAIETKGDIMKNISLGNEVIIEGYRDQKGKDETKNIYGQAYISSATLLFNLEGKKDYSDVSFIKDKSLKDISNLDASLNQTSQVYVIEAALKKVETQYYSNVYLVDGDLEMILYTGSGNQYNWASKFMDEQKYKMEVALVNWNGKQLKAGILSILDTSSNTKVFNDLNYK